MIEAPYHREITPHGDPDSRDDIVVGSGRRKAHRRPGLMVVANGGGRSIAVGYGRT